MSMYSKKNAAEERNRDSQTLPVQQKNSEKKIKEYNFKNPDKFSKDHLRVISNIHETFCRQVNMALNAALRMPTELSVANVQQMTYGDYIESMPEDLLTGVLNMFPFVTQFCMGIERHLVGAMIDRLLGGAGVSNIREELSDVELGIVKDTLRRILYYMPEGWQTLIPTTDDVELVALEQNPMAAQIVPSTDIVALVTINVEIGSYLGMMTVCIPYAALEDIIIGLSRQSSYKNEKIIGSDAKDFIVGKLANTTMPVKIVLARGTLMLSEILNLQIDDVIKMDSDAKKKSEIWIGDELKFLGKPGQVGKNLSVAITEEYDEDN